MSKETTSWRSDRLGQEIRLARWGSMGAPLLLFPTAGGDYEECERMWMVKVLTPLLEARRLKLYSVDSLGSQAMLDDSHSPEHASWVQNAFDSAVYHEVVPAIRADCKSPDIEIVTAGASLGAFNALAAVCRHPDAFSKAVCMSGTYDLARFMDGRMTSDFFHSSPLHFVPKLPENDLLNRLRQRFIVLAHGKGRWEDPKQSWRMADVLGARGVPNRVDEWGPDHDHDWPTWRQMLPLYMDDLLPK
jgi:esterase/lipase superfamily enzyme